MIHAYLTAIPSSYEGEDIEVRYAIYENQELLCRDSVIMEYVKPAVVGHTALLTLLKELKNYPDQEITLIINDPALYEFVRGTSTTKNKDVLKAGRETRKELNRFKNVNIIDIQKDHALKEKWKDALSIRFPQV